MHSDNLDGFGPVKEDSASLRAARKILLDLGANAGLSRHYAAIIDAELSAERKAAEEMAKKLQDVKAACMYHGFSDIPRQIDVVLAAYDAARKGEA